VVRNLRGNRNDLHLAANLGRRNVDIRLIMKESAMIRSLLAGASIALCAPTLAQTTIRVSVDSNGVQGNGTSWSPSITPDGRYVAFGSAATNLVPGDANSFLYDIYVYDLHAATIVRESVNSIGRQGNGSSEFPSISADGRYVVFWSYATNLAPDDTNGVRDIFVRDRQSGMTSRVSVDSYGAQADAESTEAVISADGRWVAFTSSASNLVPGDTNGVSDVFVHDLWTGRTTRVSVSSEGSEGNHESLHPAISSNGRYVAFTSGASNLVHADTNDAADYFVHDRETGVTVRVNVSSSGTEGDGSFFDAQGPPSISADGRYVAFASDADNLVSGDSNSSSDVFVHDCWSGRTIRVSVDSSGNEGNGNSYGPSISSDGRFVAFQSLASNLDPSIGAGGVFMIYQHDLLTQETVGISVNSSGQGGGTSVAASISASGRYVAFASFADDLVPGDTNMVPDAFVRDRGPASALAAFCFGDGSRILCPCSNAGALGHGCENSAGTGGALLVGTGGASLSADTVQLSAFGELPSALSIVFDGDAAIAPGDFGDGLRCAGGNLNRLYVKTASGGSITVPAAGDPTISARSAALGDQILLGSTRAYQVYYHDSNLSFCAGGFNVTNAIAIAWGG
jgi:Tol biopolymer transport system component